MANPYLSNKPIPDLREPLPWGGGHVGRRSGRVGDDLNTPVALPNNMTLEADTSKGLVSKEWMSTQGLTMCEFFKSMGVGIAEDPTFYGEVTAAKTRFDTAFEAYEKPAGAAYKEFAWDCFVQGFQSVRSLAPNVQNDAGWGMGTWVLVLGGLGVAGLFGYNYLYAGTGRAG